MCFGLVAHMGCGNSHYIFRERCDNECNPPTYGPLYKKRELQCGNREAKSQISDIRNKYGAKYDELMPAYKLAQAAGNLDELDEIRLTLRHHAREENRAVLAAKKMGREKAEPTEIKE